MRFVCTVLSLVLFFETGVWVPQAHAATPAQGASSRSDAEKVARLNGVLDELKENAHTGRLVGGVLIGGTGAVLAITGFASPAMYTAPAGAVIAGVGLTVGGVLMILYPTVQEKEFDEISALEKTPSLIREKIIRMESMLKWRSEQSRYARYAGAGMFAVLSGVSFAYYPNVVSAQQPTYLWSGVVLLGLGVVSALIRSEPERTWESYQSWDSGRADAKGASTFQISPTVLQAQASESPGLGLTALWTF